MPTPANPDGPAGARPYRLGVGAVLMNANGKVFVAKRIDTPGEAWQMPQGGIDANEDPEAAVMRELEEETGTAKAEIIDRTDDWLCYDLPENLQSRLWGGKYRGQRQLWFLLRFTGTDADIDIHADDHPEFSEWKWADIDSLPDMIVPFKRDLYKMIVSRFRHRTIGGR